MSANERYSRLCPKYKYTMVLKTSDRPTITATVLAVNPLKAIEEFFARVSNFLLRQQSGQMNQMEIAVTEEQIEKWQDGELIQNVMPELTVDEREFLISGCTAEEFEEVCKEENNGP